tara:strand:- start:57 stop:443 length:387 start_codon:yes stop_codon:yes gene_type:complete
MVSMMCILNDIYNKVFRQRTLDELTTVLAQGVEIVYIKRVKAKHSMTTTVVKHSFYKIEIDTVESPQHPIVYFRKEGKCKTQKGMDRQHDRIVGETVEAWRPFSSQIRRYTISRVPADVVVRGDIRKA